jgi:hypothetical protein
VTLERLRAELDELLESLERERLDQRLSEMRPPARGSIYQRARELFRLSHISDVQLELAGAEGENARRLRYLLAAMAEGRSESAAADELDRFLSWQTQAHVGPGAERVPMRGVRYALSMLGDAEERRALEESWLEALEEQRPLLESLMARRAEAVDELGYGNAVVSAEVLTGVDLRALGRGAEAFLRDTEPALRDLLKWYLPRLAGVEPDDATFGDGARLRRAEPYDQFFTESALHPALAVTIEASGLDPRAGGKLEIRPAPHGSAGPGASVHFLRPGTLAVVALRSGSGLPAHRSFLRALGAAMHAAYSSPDLPLEFLRLGDLALPLGFGDLFSGLLSESAMMSRHYRISSADMRDYLRLAALLDLLRVRQAAGQLCFELATADEPDADERGELYARTLGEATGLKHDPRAAPRSRRPGFQVALTIRAAQLGAVVAEHLRERCDEDWYRNPGAGAILRGLFESGRTFSAGETAVQLTSDPLTFAPLTARLREAPV